jgi:hypothetical protein
MYSLGLRCSLFLKRGRTEESSPSSQSDRGPKDAFGMLRWGKLGMRDTRTPKSAPGKARLRP